MSTRVAIYARYSSELQNASSVHDQISLCKRLILQTFGIDRPVAIYSDEAKTGATMNRPGLIQLLEAAENGEFDLLVAEGLDRISRDLTDVSQIYKILVHAGVEIWTKHEGAVSDLHVGFKGTMNALYLRDMKDKVRRAHSAIVEAGRHVSSVAYGYRPVRGVTDERGRYINGLREIDPEQAAVVLRIYQEIAAGASLGAVTRGLNRDGIPSPSGGEWRKNSLRGERSRGAGILNNELYIGWIVYNRTHKVLDPRTGRQRYKTNPENEWQRVRAEALQIIPDDLWKRVQKMRPSQSNLRAKNIRRRLAKKTPVKEKSHYGRPLTGLVVCGWCNGGKQLANDRRYVCNTFRYHSSACRNGRGTKEPKLTQQVFATLRDYLETTPDWQDQVREHFAKVKMIRQRLAPDREKIQKRIDRLVDCIAAGVQVESATQKILDLQKELDFFDNLPPLPDDLSGSALNTTVRKTLEDMEMVFFDERYTRPVQKLLSYVVEKIVLTPIEGRPRGETITVQINKTGWLEFYLFAGENWQREV